MCVYTLVYYLSFIIETYMAGIIAVEFALRAPSSLSLALAFVSVRVYICVPGHVGERISE